MVINTDKGPITLKNVFITEEQDPNGKVSYHFRWIKENKNGTVTLTVDAVCEMMLCNDSVISHELTVRFEKDGSFKYLGNKILNDGINNIPEYQYRIKK